MASGNGEYHLDDYVLIGESRGKALPAKIVKCPWKNQTYAGKWRIDVPCYRMSSQTNPKLGPARGSIRQYFCRLLNETRHMWVNVDNIVRRAPELRDRFAPSSTAMNQSGSGSSSRGSAHRAALVEKSNTSKTEEDSTEESGPPVHRSAGIALTKMESSDAEIGKAVPGVAPEGRPNTTPGFSLGRSTTEGLLHANSSRKTVAETENASNAETSSGSKLHDFCDIAAGSHELSPIFAADEVVPADTPILHVHVHIGDTIEEGNVENAKISSENEKEPGMKGQEIENHGPSSGLLPSADAVYKSVVTEAEQENDKGDKSTEKAVFNNDRNIQHGEGAVLQHGGDSTEDKEDRGDNVEAECDSSELVVDVLELNEADRAGDGEEGIAAVEDGQE